MSTDMMEGGGVLIEGILVGMPSGISVWVALSWVSSKSNFLVGISTYRLSSWSMYDWALSVSPGWASGAARAVAAKIRKGSVLNCIVMW